MNQKWDERYKEPEFAYGKEPNVFFKEWLPKFEHGKILMPADGEGRNGVFAAQLGWKVTSFDLSMEGQTKAMQLASEKGVALNYIVGDLEQLEFENRSYDAIGMIYAHFSAESKSRFHQKLDNFLRPGGIIILEAFSKAHAELTRINPQLGGPKNFDMLYSRSEIETDFKNYEVLLLEEREIILNEGKYHDGQGAVLRFVGRKSVNAL
jgi:SAM-dependent methyltransferase